MEEYVLLIHTHIKPDTLCFKTEERDQRSGDLTARGTVRHSSVPIASEQLNRTINIRSVRKHATLSINSAGRKRRRRKKKRKKKIKQKRKKKKKKNSPGEKSKAR